VDLGPLMSSPRVTETRPNRVESVSLRDISDDRVENDSEPGMTAQLRRCQLVYRRVHMFRCPCTIPEPSLGSSSDQVKRNNSSVFRVVSTNIDEVSWEHIS